MISLAYVALRIEQQSTRDEAQPADVILVLGAAEYRGRPSPVLRARLDHAFDLYTRKLAPRIMTTGGAGGDPVFTEGGVGRSYLISRGVPSEAIVVENESESTVESLAMASEIMRRMGMHSVIVVSDGYHIYRVKRMLRVDRAEGVRLAAQGDAARHAPRAVELPETGDRLCDVARRTGGIRRLSRSRAWQYSPWSQAFFSIQLDQYSCHSTCSPAGSTWMGFSPSSMTAYSSVWLFFVDWRAPWGADRGGCRAGAAWHSPA